MNKKILKENVKKLMKGGLLMTESQGKEYVKNNIDIFNSYNNNNQIFYILEYLLNIWKQQPKTLATLYIIKNIEAKLKRINNNIYQEPQYYYEKPYHYYQEPRHYYQEPRHYYQKQRYYYQEPQYYYQEPQYYYQEPIFKIKPSPKKPSPKNLSPKKPSPKNLSPKKPSPKNLSPKKPSPKNLSPKKPSPKNLSPKKPSPKNLSPKKPSPKKNIPRVLEIKPRYDISPMQYQSASISV
jgi:hypothetical protein